MTIAVISHIQTPAVPVLSRSAAAAGQELILLRPFRGDGFLAIDDLDGLIVLGGPQAAYDDEAHPYLREEIAHIAAVHRAQRPVLGICLGSHLLARATGAAAFPGEDGLECGVIDVRSRNEDVVPSGPYLSFHSDSMNLPPGAELLAETDRYVQAWRLGSSLAIQFHPELDAASFDAVLDFEEEKLTRFGIDASAIRADVARPIPSPAPAERLLDAWFAALAAPAKP